MILKVRSLRACILKMSVYQNSQPTKFIDYKVGASSNLFINQKTIQFSQQQNQYFLMKVKAVGINRAEILHRTGKYPINREQQKDIGLEAAGEIYDPFTKQKIMDGIALLPGGSYSQWTKALKSHVMPLPPKLSFSEGAAIPEAWITAYQLLTLAELQRGQSVVIYAGASGVGTAATQIARKIKHLNPFCVVSNKEKSKICKEYGALGTVNYKQNQKWSEQLLALNQKKGFNALLDCVCSSNVSQTLKLLGVDGRWVLYGTLSGIKAEMNFGQLLGKRISIISTTLKSRSNQYKDQLIKNFSRQVLPHFNDNQLKPVIHKIMGCDWTSAKSFIDAHNLMESNENIGKIIVEYRE